jgi:hypothetical protein
MKLASLVFLSLLALAALGCANDQTVRGREVSQPRAISEANARSVAERKAAEAGYDLNIFRVVSVEYEREGSFKDTWRVFFEQVPPTPPGGHFIVYVNAASGEARLFPGE